MNLIKLRKDKKLTQKQVAKIINVAPTTYLGYEKETSEPTIATLKSLADFYGVSMDYLCGRQYDNQIGYIPDTLKDVFKKMLHLKERQVDKVDAYITALLDE